MVQAAVKTFVPEQDATVVESLPRLSPQLDAARRQSREQALQMPDLESALVLSRHYLEQARAQGDPRYAGYALAALQPWHDLQQAPAAVWLMRAMLAQHLHDFAGAQSLLTQLLQRESSQGSRDNGIRTQAWLIQASIARVQGHYLESDQACRQVATGSLLHATACLAENAALRGQWAAARAMLQPWLNRADLPSSSRAWLLTTLAELEERAGRRPEAERAWQQALAAERSSYGVLAYADFLLAGQRPAEALAVLHDAPLNDGVLLRKVLAETALQQASALQHRKQLATRYAEADARVYGTTPRTHGREEARFALHVQNEARLALQLARENLQMQKEPADLLIFAQAARAAVDQAALQDLRQLLQKIGLQDARIQALL